MIPAPNTMTQIDELPGEEILFGIGDPRFVMQTQADLYSDVVTAVIREYSTNAYDAHVMAGNPDPIEVTLPTMMHPYFRVKDQGVGMNVDLFRRVYTQFGVSDKRKSNKTNGMLGYGSKSGVAYTNSFTVTTVRDGVKTIGVVNRKPDWSIVLKVVSTAKTTEPNGTEIVIPVSDWKEFQHKAKEFYKYWLPGRVLVDGVEPDHAVGEKITDNFYYSKEWNTSYVVMGNVAYRIANPSALFRDSRMNHVNFVAYVDNFKSEDGAAPVEFTPSREDLKYTDRTKATLQAVIDDFAKQIIDRAAQDISVAKNHAEAFAAWSKWANVLGRQMFSDLEYKGDKFEPEFAVHGKRHTLANGGGTSYVRTWAVENMSQAIIITDFDITPSSASKKKIREYLALKGFSARYAVLITGPKSNITSKWVDTNSERFVSWNDLKAALPKTPVKPRTGNPAWNAGRAKGTFDYWTTSGREYEKSVPEDAKNLYYITVYESKIYQAREILNYLDESDAIVVLLPQNRLAKFKRDYPGAKQLIPYARKRIVTNASTLLSHDAMVLLSIPPHERRWLRSLDLTRIDDPAIIADAGRIKNEDKLLTAYKKNNEFAATLRMATRVDRFEPPSRGPEGLFAKYPLLDVHGHYNVHSHVYVYLNAAYAAELEGKNA